MYCCCLGAFGGPLEGMLHQQTMAVVPGLKVPIQGVARLTGAKSMGPSPDICFFQHPFHGIHVHISFVLAGKWLSPMSHRPPHVFTDHHRAWRNMSILQATSVEFCWPRSPHPRTSDERRGNDALPSPRSLQGFIYSSFLETLV